MKKDFQVFLEFLLNITSWYVDSTTMYKKLIFYSILAG